MEKLFLRIKFKISLLLCLFLFSFSCVSFAKTDFTKESSKLKAGIISHKVSFKNERQETIIHILEIDPESKNISFKAGLADENQIKIKDRLTSIVLKNMAYVGINSNYFDVKEGNTIGTLITDGMLITGPVFDRVCIGFTKDKKVLIDRFMLVGNVTVLDSSLIFNIDSLNVPYHLIKETGFYSPVWDKEINVPDGKIALVVENNCVTDITNSLAKISNNGYVILGNNENGLEKIKKNDCLKIAWEEKPSLSDIKEAISGGPYLVKDSMAFIDWEEEGFKPPVKNPYTARSAIGINKDKKLFLVLVEGGEKDNSGLSLPELADFLVDFGLSEAINLDGGGSSTLVVDGKIINKLHDKHERKISSGLLVLYRD